MSDTEAVTVKLPISGKKVRIVEYQDGRIRFRIYNASPMTMTELFTGAYRVGTNVVVSFAPVGYKGDEDKE